MLPVSGAEQLNTSGADLRAAHDLAQRRVFEVGQPGAVLRLGQEQVPQTGRARLRPSAPRSPVPAASVAGGAAASISAVEALLRSGRRAASMNAVTRSCRSWTLSRVREVHAVFLVCMTGLARYGRGHAAARAAGSDASVDLLRQLPA